MHISFFYTADKSFLLYLRTKHINQLLHLSVGIRSDPHTAANTASAHLSYGERDGSTIAGEGESLNEMRGIWGEGSASTGSWLNIKWGRRERRGDASPCSSPSSNLLPQGDGALDVLYLSLISLSLLPLLIHREALDTSRNELPLEGARERERRRKEWRTGGVIYIWDSQS